MKRISLFILTLLLLLTSLPTGYAIQKGDDKGGVLNLPPFVDFEVKEKRKVDVIVDVGNTSKSIDEVNSLVNEYLRPSLQANGLDYKIHVEKSNEGLTHFYYFDMPPGETHNYATALFKYDLLTNQSTMLYDTTLRGHDHVSVLDPETGLIFSNFGKAFYTDISSIPEQLRQDQGWNLGMYGLLDSEGNIFGSTEIAWSAGDYYQRKHTTRDRVMEAILAGNGNDIRNVVDTYCTPGMSSMYCNSGLGGIDSSPSNAIPYLNGGVIYRNNFYNNSWSLNNNFLKYWTEYDLTNRIGLVSFGIPSHWVSDMSYSKETGEIVMSVVTGQSYDSGFGRYIATKYVAAIFDPKTGKARTIDALYNYERRNTSEPHAFFMDGKKLLLKYNYIPNDISQNARYDYFYFEDYLTTTEPIMLQQELGLPSLGTVQLAIGDLAIFKDTRAPGGIHIVDVENMTSKKIETNTLSPYIVELPPWYKAEKRYMKDILNENITRSDAEKYYIRLDDQALMQLKNSKELADLATEMNRQNVTYLALGNNNNKTSHQNLLNAIDQRGTFIDNTNIGSAMSKAVDMITNKREAELHVLIANETLSLATIKDGLKQVQTELQAENIISSINIIQGTSTSKTFELMSQINWRSDRNNYVVMFNRGSMSELNNAEYEVEIATVLSAEYAGYISIGTTANKAVNESLIATNKNGGVFTNSTTMSTIKTVIAKHIKDTAVKNPKRVTDTLVLNYDQETGEYSSDLIINTYYEDFENDPKFTERFKTTHDPTIYENHTGVMEGIGQYQPSPTTKFTKVGKYEMVVQVQDNPSNNAVFANFREWSLDSLSRLVLFVHRAPVADFTAVVNTSRRLTIVDLSYDLDRYSERNKGIVTAVWKWKKVDDADWTSGSPPTTLAANTDYLISLKVKDRDGAWSNEVIKFVTTKDSNQPPVALFTVNPKTSSWSKTFSITDQSYDPDGDTITKREWIVTKDGKQLLTKASTPTGNEIKNAAINAGLSQLGSYQIRLRVQDRLGLWSTWYQDYAYVVNHAPIAQFEPLTTTYRDTMNAVVNLTANPDIDGDAVNYRWRLMKGDKTYSLGTTKDVSFRIRDRGLGKDAVGTWSLELRAADPLGAESYITHSLQVLNQVPTAEIISYPVYGYVDEPYNFAATSDDPDTEDKSSLQYYWKVTTPSAKVIMYYEKNLSNITFKEKGEYTMEHWVMDQLGAESEVDKVEFTILNKLPIPDFTRTPITTYRNVNIDFKSLSTDPDGWLEAYRYELFRNGQTPLTLSTDEVFTRSFSSIGTFDIRHTVTDNDGASASITKQIYIVNRAPKVVVTQPSGTNIATATEFNTLTPTILWAMTDADNDPQVQYQLQLKNQSGTVLRTTAATTTANKQFVIPNGWLEEGPVYRAAVRAYDGYDWGEYSTDKYFYILLNRPPTPGFTYTPTNIYEGDQLKFRHAVDDLDLDTLSVRYIVTAPNGQKSQYPSSSTYYQVSSNQYSSDAFSISNVMPGNYVIEQTVTDSKSEPVKVTQTIRVGKLGIVGQVTHTELWESNRNDYNESLPVGSSNQWLPQQFYSGERFMLSADTTLADHAETGSTTYAMKVTVLLHTTGTKTELTYEKDFQWSGSMWEESFNNLARGKHTFTFTVHYSNGVVKQNDVEIEIIGKASELAGVHRWK